MSTTTSVAAFFDLDGTLLPPPSLEWRFISYLLWHDKLGTLNIFRWLAHAGRSLGRGPRHAVEANKQYLAGLSESLVADWGKSLQTGGVNSDTPRAFDEGLQRIRWHQSQDHRVFIVTGTLAPLARDFATRLPGNIEVIATDLSVSSGMRPCAIGSAAGGAGKTAYLSMWTGALAGEHMVGSAKNRALRVIATRHHLELRACYAYGDSIADRAMLEAVGHPTAVNASRSLERLARKCGWQVSQWVSTSTSASGATRGSIRAARDSNTFQKSSSVEQTR
jgi:phosphoserine phosphatase